MHGGDTSEDPGPAGRRDDPIVEATYTATPKEMIASMREALGPLNAVPLVIAALLVVVAVLARWPGQVFFAAVFVGLWYAAPRISLRGQLDGTRTITLTATEDTVTKTNDLGHVIALGWANFSSARHRKSGWVLVAGRMRFLVPDRAFDPGQASAFEALVRRKGLVAGS